MKNFLPYIISVVLLAALDFVWLGLIMADFYRENIGHLMRDSIALIPGVLFYLLYTAGVFVFAVLPAVRSGKALRALTLGLFFGFVAFGLYDLTNQATLRDWPIVVTVADMLWGSLATGIIALTGFVLVRKFDSKKESI